MSLSNPILVTGGAGYIGSHTCKMLANQDYTPITFDNLSYGHERAVKWGPLEVGDLSDPQRIDAVIKDYKPLAVIHFAAYSLVGESVREPGKYYANNVGGTLNLLNAMRENGLDKIVFSSTCATYGIPSDVPIRETTPQSPVNPYGHSKLTVEQMLKDYDTAHSLRHVALRYFNACGADRDGEIGEEHEPETHLIPRILQAMTGHGPAFSIFGEDYATPDGTCIRDYIHVDDLAHGHLLALRYLIDGGQSQQLNLGTGHGYSVREIVDAVEKVTGRKVEYGIGPRRAGDPPELTADTTKAREVLGFETSVSDLETIVSTAWKFHLSTAK
jgi:UDP-glucose-4-epimerase GalE